MLITDVSDDHARVLMWSNERDAATETDAELAPRLTGCPYRLLVHGDLAGSIMRTGWSDLRGGSIRRSFTESSSAVAAWTSTPAMWRRTPIVSESDPRWDTKTERLKQLRTVKARASELGLRISPLTPH